VPGCSRTILWYAGLLVLGRLAYTLYAWWDEVLVVTDKRFVLITGVFTTRVAMMPLSKVTDLTYERNRVGPHLRLRHRRGGVGGSDPRVSNRIDHLPQPEQIYDAISELVLRRQAGPVGTLRHDEDQAETRLAPSPDRRPRD